MGACAQEGDPARETGKEWTCGQKSTRECSQKEDMVNWLDDAEKPSEMCAGFDKVEDTVVRKVFWGTEARMRG